MCMVTLIPNFVSCLSSAGAHISMCVLEFLSTMVCANTRASRNLSFPNRASRSVEFQANSVEFRPEVHFSYMLFYHPKIMLCIIGFEFVTMTIVHDCKVQRAQAIACAIFLGWPAT